MSSVSTAAIPITGRGLRYAYPDGPLALDGVDFDLNAGEFVALVGPNGSGKSTLVRALGGLQSGYEGHVTLFGRDIARLGPKERARLVASVPQRLSALPETSVEAFVFGGRYAHIERFGSPTATDVEAVRAALAAVDVEGWEQRQLTELSGGECQRVLLARALAQEARVLFLDEPTTSLDPTHQVQAFEFLARFVAEGRSVCVTTHELSLASRFADRIVLLQAGRVRASGAVPEVFTHAVLDPVYGPNLFLGPAPGGAGAGQRPIVVPWPGSDGMRS